MAVHKFIFWISEKGIKTYRVKKNDNYELIRYQGNDTYPNSDLKFFFNSDWFTDIASIAEDDYIDFCFLSRMKKEVPKFAYMIGQKSSWNKKDIQKFCEKYIQADNYKVIADSENAEKNFVYQTGNIYEKNQITDIYLKCVPEFSMEGHDSENIPPEEDTSVLYRYYKDLLNKL